MIRRAFLKCCVSAALAVGAFYGGMGLPDFSSDVELNSFSEFEMLIREARIPFNRNNDDDPVWKIIQDYNRGAKIYPPYSIEDDLLCRKVFRV